VLLHEDKSEHTLLQRAKTIMRCAACSKIFLGNQLQQFRTDIWHFGDCLCLCHQRVLWWL